MGFHLSAGALVRRTGSLLLAATLLVVMFTASASAAPPTAPPGSTQTTNTFSSTATETVPGYQQGTLTSSITVSGQGLYLSDVQAFTKLFHTFPADLRVVLTAPSGESAVLTDGEGDGNDNVFSATQWADSATSPVSRTTYSNNVAKPALTPEQSFSRFVGINPNGVWKLQITDQGADDDTGILKGWSLDVSTLTEPPILTSHHNEGNGVSSPDLVTPVTSTINVQNVPSGGGTVWGVKVGVKIAALARGGTKVSLTSPSGHTIQLVSDNLPPADVLTAPDGLHTQSTNPYFGTVFDDSATTNVTNAVATGDTPMPRLAPVQPLDGFRGEDPGGNWKLTVSDPKSAVNGADFLDSWTLDIVTAANLAVPASGTLCTPTTTTPSVFPSSPKTVNFHNFTDTNGWTTLDLPVSGVGTYLHSVQVTTQVSTPAASKLRLQLVAPNGRVVWLTRDNGATTGLVGDSTATFNGTVFDDDAGQINPPGSVAESAIPTDVPLSPVAPLQPLASLVGSNPNGTWTLRAFDDRAAIISGTERAMIRGFSLKITTQPQAPVRQKAQVTVAGPLHDLGGILSQPLILSGAGTVLDQLEVSIDAPDLPPGTLIFLEGPGPQNTQVTLNGAYNPADPGTRLFGNMTFTDSATRAINGNLLETSGPDTGQGQLSLPGTALFSPLQPLGAVRGENPNGTWRVIFAPPGGISFTVNNISLLARTSSCPDATPPTNPTLSSPTHTVGTPSASRTLTVDFSGATDDVGVDGYAYDVDQLPDGDASTTKSADGTATSATVTPLADGSWYFHLRTVDAAGNWSSTVTSGPYIVDNSVPDTTIDSGPSGPTGHSQPTFAFSASKPSVTYECSIDSGLYAACTSPFTPLVPLLDGDHTFSVQATDTLSRTDPSPATRSFTVDTSLPDTTITGGPTGAIATASPSWTFTSSKPGSTFTCAIDGGAAVACTSPFAPASPLSDGPHTFTVYATDAGGNDDATPATQSVTVDTVAPQTSFTTPSPPAGATINYTPSFGLSAGEPATFECKVDGGSFAACTSPFSTGTLAAGDHTVAVRATDAVGNVGALATRTVTVDTAAPNTSFSSGAIGLVATTQPTVTLASTEAGSTFECAIDTDVFVTCASPWTTPVLGQGLHTLKVRATDAAGNVDDSPATRTVTVDTIPPDTTLGDTPTGTTGASPAFTFSSLDGDVISYECALDGGSYSLCASPKTFGPFSDGSHWIDVRAVDAAGNKDASPAERHFTVDATAPVTTLTGAPVVSNAAGTAQVSFTANDASATFACAVGSGDYTPCTSPWTTPRQDDGTYTLKVRGTDALGNVEAPPATAPFTIDATAPDTTMDSGPSGAVSSTSATFTFSSDDHTASFRCNLDDSLLYAPCTSPLTLPEAGQPVLAQGDHTLRVQAYDAAGNADATPATRTWTVDTVAPHTTISSGPDTTSGATATFAFSSEAGSTFACRLDSAAPQPCTSPQTYPGLTAGGHTFRVTATDAAQNVEVAPPTRSFTTDLTAPDVTITDGPADGGRINTDRPTFAFASSKPNSSFLCAMDSDDLMPCVSGAPLDRLSPGLRTFWVVAVDALGNESGRAQRTFTVDLVAPSTTVVTPPAAVSTTGTPTGVVSSSESGTFECNVDDGAWFACSATWVTPTLANGAHRIGVRAVDLAGNADATPAYFDVTVAVPAPPPPLEPVDTTPVTPETPVTPPTTTAPTTTTSTTPVTPPASGTDRAVTLVAPSSKTPSLKLVGKPLTLTRTAVTLALRCPTDLTRQCRTSVKIVARGKAKTRGLTFASFNGKIQPSTTILRSSMSTRNKRAIKGLKTVSLQLTVTMSSATGKSATHRWNITVPVG